MTLEKEVIAAADADHDAQLYLSFILNGEEYGLDILRVQEILSWKPVSRIPNTPDYLQGVFNLRGNIIPIVDLRPLLTLPSMQQDETNVVIILQVNSAEKQRSMGVVVDAVTDTYSLNVEDILTAPDMAGGIPAEFISGLATINEDMVILLDIDTLMNSGDLASDPTNEQ